MLRLPSFEYVEPKTLKQALKIRDGAGADGMYVAGGTDLYPNMKRRHQEPKIVISLSRIKGMSDVRTKDGRTSVGAGITLTDLASHRKIKLHYRALAVAAESISTPILRNIGQGVRTSPARTRDHGTASHGRQVHSGSSGSRAVPGSVLERWVQGRLSRRRAADTALVLLSSRKNKADQGAFETAGVAR